MKSSGGTIKGAAWVVKAGHRYWNLEELVMELLKEDGIEGAKDLEISIEERPSGFTNVVLDVTYKTWTEV